MNPSDDDLISRRRFVAGTAASLGVALASGGVPLYSTEASAEGPAILFQGDSITDCGRARLRTGPNDAQALGTGYPLLVAAELLRAHPKRGLRIYNRGVSGDRVPDLKQRWKGDTLALKPDVLSILIGVNDLWHKLMGRSSGTVEEYELGFEALLGETRSALPKGKLVVLEPFVLRCGAVTDAWFPEFDQRRTAAARVARGAYATWIPMHEIFQRLTSDAPPEYWAPDGVHPSPAGHAAIARAWMQAVRI